MSLVRTVLLIGDVLLDRYLDCTASRVAPEAPVLVLEDQQPPRVFPGGAGNVAANLRGLGAGVRLLTAWGGDPEGHFLRQLLENPPAGEENAGWVTLHGPQRPEWRTATKTRILAGGQLLLRLDRECRPLAPAAELDGYWPEELARLPGPCDAIVVSDYAKGVCTPGLLAWIREAQARGTPVFVDAKAVVLRELAGCFLAKINFREACSVAEQDGYVHPALGRVAGQWGLGFQAAAEALAEYVRTAYRYYAVVVTCGPLGAVASTSAGCSLLPAESQAFGDPVGAGDTFLAALVSGYLLGLPLGQAVGQANVAAGLAVAQPGVYTVTRTALDEACRSRTGRKHCTRSQAVTWVKERQGQGRSVALANGCFDGLHPGHLSLLRFAKQQGDELVVAYNDDASVRRLKGPSRPLFPEAHRGALLEHVPEVDLVVCFGDDDAGQLVQDLSPDVLVKGADSRQPVPGAAFLAGRGGRVVFAPCEPGYSTSEIARAIGVEP